MLVRTVDIDPTKYADKTVVVGVRVHGPSGQDDGWSRLISLEVKPVLPAPRDLKAANARDAVHLQWTASAPAFRIFRKTPADSEWAQIGDSTQPSFDDKAIEYGKILQYRVESVRKTGEIWQESDPSEAISWTPKDEFPPAVPTGLVTISGTRSVELSWDRVTDSDLAGYRVYRNGVKVAEGLQTPSYSDKDVVAGMKYSYQVSAVDQAGNESGKSVAEEATME
jgi:fibronectin type 3 domain-containing protein